MIKTVVASVFALGCMWTHFRGKVATFDPEKSGLGFLLMNQDTKFSPNFWELAKALGSVEVKVYTSTGAMLERVS